MSKVIIYHTVAKDTYPVSAAVKATGWLPGQFGALNATAESIKIAVTDESLFMLIDDDLEVSAPPTGSVVTGIYGAGTKVVIDHSAEVAASSATRAYASSCESAAINADLYVDASGKLTSTATGSVKGKMFQKPSADNNYSIGVIFRI